MEIKDKDTLLKLIAEKADDAAAFSGGAQVVSIEDVYELLSPNSFENIARKYSHYYNDAWHFSDEFLKQFAEALLEDKEREVEQLNNAVQDALLSSRECRRKLVEQGIYSNDLREALEDISNWTFGWDGDCGVTAVANKALSKTPAQSLQEHDNEVIEKCANDLDRQGFNHAGDAIRALKG